ncbi:MAG: YHS domain-containing (seleno)protein [Pseudomonadota bacterium]
MKIATSTAQLIASGGLLMCAFSAQAINPYFTNQDGALKGYDPVAYFAQQKALKGDPRFTHQWQGSEWRFASAENLQAFKADPEKYAPQFGGYCAYGVSQGYAPAVDPTAYTIVDGKLYLNYNATVSLKWNADREGYISLGRQNWPALKAGDKTYD